MTVKPLFHSVDVSVPTVSRVIQKPDLAGFESSSCHFRVLHGVIGEHHHSSCKNNLRWSLEISCVALSPVPVPVVNARKCLAAVLAGKAGRLNCSGPLLFPCLCILVPYLENQVSRSEFPRSLPATLG